MQPQLILLAAERQVRHLGLVVSAETPKVRRAEHILKAQEVVL